MQLHVENFKSLRDVTVKVHPQFTILVGPNASGKSNILDALTFVSGLTSCGQMKDYLSGLGGPGSLVFFGERTRNLLFELQFTLEDADILSLQEALEASPKDEFLAAFQQKEAVFRIILGWQAKELTLLSEELWVNVKGRRVQWAKSSWEPVHHVITGEMTLRYYVVENLTEALAKNEWRLSSHGGGAPPPLSILQQAKNSDHPRWHLLKLLGSSLWNTSRLAAVRSSEDKAKLIGRYSLASDAGNLPQVLHSLASSRRNVLDTIIRDAGALIPEWSDILSAPKEGGDEAHLSVKMRPWQVELQWRDVASGPKEIAYLLTFIHSTPKGALLLVEEPELHLHPQSIGKLRDIIQRCASDEDKQFILTTHSLTMIDAVPLERIQYVRIENGATRVLDTRDYSEVEAVLGAAQVPKSLILAAKSSVLIIVVEGRDDVKIWRQFLSRSDIDLSQMPIRIVSGLRSGGYTDVLSACKFLSRIGPPVSYYAILDGDAKQGIDGKLSKENLKEENFHFLAKGEIEDYLVEPAAIAALLNRSQEEVKAVVECIGGHGKERLASILRKLGVSKPSPEVKELLVVHMPELPTEVRNIIAEISLRASGFQS